MKKKTHYGDDDDDEEEEEGFHTPLIKHLSCFLLGMYFLECRLEKTCIKAFDAAEVFFSRNCPRA